MLLVAASSSSDPPWLLYVPAAIRTVGVVTWLLGIATFVKVRVRQTLIQGPLVAWGVAGAVIAPPDTKSDGLAFAVINHSLLHPVFVRRIGAEGRDSAGELIKVKRWLDSPPVRLERGQGHPWEMSFNELAEGGIDVGKGVRGWATIDGREKRYRSRWIQLHSTGDRTIPMPAPRLRPR